MGQESICGLNLKETTCSEMTIKTVPAIDFQVRFMDGLVELFNSVEQPKIATALFTPLENSPLNVTIIPVSILDTPNHVSTGFQVITRLHSNATDKLEAYSSVLMMYKLFVNFIEKLSKREGLTYLHNFAITNSGEATISLTFNKQFDALTSAQSI